MSDQSEEETTDDTAAPDPEAAHAGRARRNVRLTQGVRRGTVERVEALDWAGSGPSLFEERIKVFPRQVKGQFRTMKWAFLVPLLSIYYFTPWIRWDRGPYAPDQAVLIDLPARRFYFFWIEIWPQEI